MAGGIVGLGDVRAGELALALPSCSTPESGPFTSPGQHIPWWYGCGRANPEGMRAELAPAALLTCASGELATEGLGSSPWWWGWGRAGRMTNSTTNQAPEPDLWVGPLQQPPPSHNITCWSTWKGWSCRPKATVFSRNRARTEYPRRVPVRAHHR